jgi:phosphopantetheinyl transferase (holo-ACP synthase)
MMLRLSSKGSMIGRGRGGGPGPAISTLTRRHAHHEEAHSTTDPQPNLVVHMTGGWALGNDVVDTLHHGGAGKGRDARFQERVFAPSERDVIRSSPDPDLSFWVHWVGKEAVFKSTSKVLGTPPVFHHRLFRVAFPEEGLRGLLDPSSPHAPLPLLGRGSYMDFRFRISVERRGTCIHAVSWMERGEPGDPEIFAECRGSTAGAAGPSSDLQDRFSTSEWECVTHRASALTRLAARESLASFWDVSEKRLEIRCGPGLPGRRIPSVWLDGEELLMDLTLSHHGRFLAWAFLMVEG